MSIRRVILTLFVIALAPMLTTSLAMATNNIHGNWEVFYGFADANPVDDSLTDAGSTECQLCHLDSNGGQPWNAYGFELHLNGVDFAAADIVDSDGDLSTHETFPSGREVQMRISTAVRATNGRALSQSALASSSVGGDGASPEIEMAPPK